MACRPSRIRIAARSRLLFAAFLGALLGGCDSDPSAVEPPDNDPDPDFELLRQGREELWAWGLRNPWRFGLDEQEGLLYIADVGQSDAEEVNVAPADATGRNYGWSILEGHECHEEGECGRDDLVDPVVTYPHPEG